MFGADALNRKFGSEPPQEWIAALTTLNDAQLANGLNGLVREGSGHLPTLPEFIKQCRTSPAFSSRRLQITHEDAFDEWDMAANQHLLAYIMQKPKRYHPDSTYAFDPETKRHRAMPGPEGTRRTQCLVQAKNEWAQCMREEAQSGSVPIADQKSSWAVFMGQAEERIGA